MVRLLNSNENMDNKEEILDALNCFGKKPIDAIPPLLENYLRQVALTGETWFPWQRMKPLFVHKLNQVMTSFNEEYPADHLPSLPNVENVTFENIKRRILTLVESFNGAPFTIQRLCELIIEPTKHYKRCDKFMRGLEKNFRVVSTVDPFGRKIVCESTTLLNGIDANGHMLTSRVDEPMGELVSPFQSPLPVNAGAVKTATATSESSDTSIPQSNNGSTEESSDQTSSDSDSISSNSSDESESRDQVAISSSDNPHVTSESVSPKVTTVEDSVLMSESVTVTTQLADTSLSSSMVVSNSDSSSSNVISSSDNLSTSSSPHSADSEPSSSEASTQDTCDQMSDTNISRTNDTAVNNAAENVLDSSEVTASSGSPTHQAADEMNPLPVSESVSENSEADAVHSDETNEVKATPPNKNTEEVDLKCDESNSLDDNEPDSQTNVVCSSADESTPPVSAEPMTTAEQELPTSTEISVIPDSTPSVQPSSEQTVVSSDNLSSDCDNTPVPSLDSVTENISDSVHADQSHCVIAQSNNSEHNTTSSTDQSECSSNTDSTDQSECSAASVEQSDCREEEPMDQG